MVFYLILTDCKSGYHEFINDGYKIGADWGLKTYPEVRRLRLQNLTAKSRPARSSIHKKRARSTECKSIGLFSLCDLQIVEIYRSGSVGFQFEIDRIVAGFHFFGQRGLGVVLGWDGIFISLSRRSRCVLRCGNTDLVSPNDSTLCVA